MRKDSGDKERMEKKRSNRSIPDIPERARWEIAAGIASSLPGMYYSLFHPVVGKGYDHLEEEIWQQLAREAGDVARTYGFPVGSAGEVAAAVSEIASIFFGPRYGTEVIDLSSESAVIIVKHCPFLKNAHQPGMNTESLFHGCMAFSVLAIHQINPQFSVRFVRSVCMGDRTCELKIAPREIIEREISR
ncbi:MAG: hypothetical protein LUQ25_03620 [Methanoregulaceae archaeon]|nr:hypothetical protein [Methanoregulaceae archaeon]